MRANPESFLPLTSPTLYILLSLVPGQKHGYAILKDVHSLSEGRISLSTSTLYNALGRLLEQELIRRVPTDPEEQARPGLPRKAYVLTDAGLGVLEAELERMRTLVATARLRLSEGRT